MSASNTKRGLSHPPEVTGETEPKAHPAGARGSVRVYRQGLGDCILVRLNDSAGKQFKLMIDCGVVLGTEQPQAIMTRVMQNIVAETDGSVDVLAITHEHWDHLSGVIQAADAFERLGVGEVWVAWTEDPDDKLASELKGELGKAQQALAFGASAYHMAGAQDRATELIDLAGFGAAAAQGDASTKAAFATAKAKAVGKPPRICKPTDQPVEIPGCNARVYVLGPPHDPQLIRKINPSRVNPETYALALDRGGVMPPGVYSAIAPEGTGADIGRPFHPRVMIPTAKAQTDDEISFFRDNYFGRDDWRRIDSDWLEPASSLALALQSYTNNTSLVLAVELGEPGRGDVLLFAGDAQVGNWESWQNCQWSQQDPKVTGPSLLARTIFYKVGHHGSHNATLRSHGIEEMTSLKSAVIPVDEEMAKRKRWGHMPLPQLIAVLEQKLSGPNVLRTDNPPAQLGSGITVTDDFVEVAF